MSTAWQRIKNAITNIMVLRTTVVENIPRKTTYGDCFENPKG
jgi:hypothetical protein